jgi:hypothetical protein
MRKSYMLTKYKHGSIIKSPNVFKKGVFLCSMRVKSAHLRDYVR